MTPLRSIIELGQMVDVNMKTRIKNKNEKGQALVETILLIPFLFFTFIYLYQFYVASQTSEVIQEKTRNSLVSAIDNWRDLRNRNQVNMPPGLAIDNIQNQQSLGLYREPGRHGRLIYKNTNTVTRDVGPKDNGKGSLNIETKLGVCRTVSCN